MKKKIILISTLFLLIMAFNSSDLYAFRTSYVYVYANHESGYAVENFDVHIYESHYADPNRLKIAGEARGKNARFTLAVDKVYFVSVKKQMPDGGFLAGGTSFRVYNQWSNEVTVRVQSYR